MKTQTVQITTDDGDLIEATKDDRDSSWDINYPWGSTRFYGSIVEVRALMKQIIRAHEKDEAGGPT